MDLLKPEQTVFEAVQEHFPLENIGTIRNLCAAFLFQGDDVEKRIANLSGGEKSRVILATLLGRPLNFLVLDEPTNHLDIQSRKCCSVPCNNSKEPLSWSVMTGIFSTPWSIGSLKSTMARCGFTKVTTPIIGAKAKKHQTDDC